MNRETNFKISHKPFAVDLDSLRTTTHERHDGTHYYGGRINAVWYRRRSGQTYACTGTLWDYQDQQPPDGTTFLRRHTDGRYGGDCAGRWDGTRYWGAQEPEVMAAHLAVLRPMLDQFPVIPEGYDGWWTFQTGGAR